MAKIFDIRIVNNVLSAYRNNNIEYQCFFKREGLKMNKYLYYKDNVLFKIQARISLIPPSLVYTFISQIENTIVTMNYSGFLKPVYKIKFDNDIYDIIPHRGTKTSIFLNKEQIAHYETNLLNSFNEERLLVTCSDDINQDLILCIVCSLSFDINDTNGFTVNIGNIGFEAKKFDHNWQPN